MAMENLAHFQPRSELIREAFVRKIEWMIRASSFAGSADWVIEWEDNIPPVMRISEPQEDGTLRPISVDLCNEVRDFISDFTLEDSQFPYTPNLMQAGDRIGFEKK